MRMSDKYYRLVTLLVDISTKVLLTLFLDLAKKHSVPGVPYTTLQIYLSKRQSDIKKYVTRFQYNIIYSSSSTCDGSEWDISLLSSLILGLFGAHVRPINGDIKAIKDIRNGMQHSASTASVSDGDFKSLWDNICTSTLAIAFHVKGNVYENEVKEKITLLSTSTFIPRQGESLRIWYTSYAENTSSIFKEEVMSLQETLQKNIEEHKQETLLLKTKILEHKGETVKLKEQIVEHRNETVGLRSKIVDQSSELVELKEKMVQLQKQSVDIETDCRTSSSILKCAAVKRTSCTGKPTKRFKTLSQSLERMYDAFKKAMNAEQLEDVDPPDKIDEIRRRIASDRFVVVAGYGKSSYLRTALYVIQSLNEYKPEYCVMITDPSDWKHIEPKELKLVLFKSPFGEGEPNKEKTRAMLNILNNVQLTTKDSEHQLVVIVVTQWDIMQTALMSVDGHHELLDEPVILYKENNEQEPEIIDDGMLNQTVGTKINSMKTMIELTKSYREDYNYPVNEEAVKSVRVKMKKSKFVLISGVRRDMNTAVALRLANDYDDSRFVIVRNKYDISNINLRNISLLMVEDIAGKYKYDDARLADWLEAFDSLLTLVRKGKLNLVATIESDKIKKGKQEFGQHSIFGHEVRVSPSDSICVKHEMDNPFASVTTQERRSKGGVQLSNSPVNDSDHTSEESDDEYDASDNEPNSGSMTDSESTDTISVRESESNEEYAVSDEESDDDMQTDPTLRHVADMKLMKRDEDDDDDDDMVESGTISGMTVVEDRLLVAVDLTNDCLRCFDLSTSTQVSRYDMQLDEPNDITTLPGSRVAVTFPFAGEIHFMEVKSQSGEFLSINKINVDEGCHGIVYSDNKLIVLYRGYTSSKVQILDMEGNVQHVFEKDTHGENLFSWPEHVAVSPDHNTIYVSDRMKDTVTALTRDGHVLGVVQDKDNLHGPRGLTVDATGCVYVCDYDSNTVCLVSPETGSVIRLLGKEGVIPGPHSVAVCDKTRRLYVGIYDSSEIKVFKIE